MPRSNSSEVSFRVEQRMRRVKESVVDRSDVYNSTQFIRQSIENNIEYIHDKVKGQKELRDFILDLNCDVEWLNISVPECSIDFKLEVDKELSVYQDADVKEEVVTKLDKCSRSSGFSRSSIIRACIVRELYKHRDVIEEPKRDKVVDRWTVIKSKIEKLNNKLVDNLYYDFQEDFIMNKATDELEVKNMYYIEEHYKLFKDTDGYKFASSVERGIEFIDTIESAIAEYNS